MKILVDADACPVKDIIIKHAKKNNIELSLYFDNSHSYNTDYGKVFILDVGRDSVDLKIVSDTTKGDLIITNDYALASLILGKGAYTISFYGSEYTNDNIMSYLMRRHINQKLRQAKKRVKGPKKRLLEDDLKFENMLTSAINKYL